jgi:hypothetical protein
VSFVCRLLALDVLGQLDVVDRSQPWPITAQPAAAMARAASDLLERLATA